jgi:hypothetical protein
MVDPALEGLRLQYPGYAEELERRFIRRTAPRPRSVPASTSPCGALSLAGSFRYSPAATTPR